MGAEVVLAVPRFVIDEFLPEGFSNMFSLNAFADAIRGHVIWGDRAELKAKREDAQAIAYNVYVIEGEGQYDADEIVVYQRAKTVGEELLHGDHSAGFGGHVDRSRDERLTDHGYVDFVQTLLASQAREDGEEITITDKGGNVIKPTYAHIGWINDNSNPIGQIHFAGVFLARLPHGSKVVSNEPNQIMQPGKTIRDFVRDETTVYENWTRLLKEPLYHMFTSHGKLATELKSIG